MPKLHKSIILNKITAFNGVICVTYYIVLYELINNPTPNSKYPIFVSIIEEKYMKIFDARGYLTFLALSC